MNLVIPMAGEGSRFFDVGYKLPKYMLEAHGKSLFHYSLSSFPLEIFENIIFIALKSHQKKYKVKKFIKEEMIKLSQKYNYKNNYKTILLENKTEGQAQTVLKAKKFIDKKSDLVIYNIDTHFRSDELKIKLLNSKLKKDGILGTVKLNNPKPKWSFAKLNDNDIVIKTVEKEVISNFALTGMYHFTKASDFINTAQYFIDNNIKEKNEYYIAPMYNFLISQGKKFKLDIVNEFTPLGVPKDLEAFRNE
jgi:dTDP-glucose pyrophosphorylase